MACPDHLCRNRVRNIRCMHTYKRKGKKEYLYSTSLHQGTHKALRHGSHSFTCKQHHACRQTGENVKFIFILFKKIFIYLFLFILFCVYVCSAVDLTMCLRRHCPSLRRSYLITATVASLSLIDSIATASLTHATTLAASNLLFQLLIFVHPG